MKRILSTILVLMLMCNIAVPAASASFQIGASSTVIAAGQQVTIEVTLDETLTHENNFRNCQGELYYDSELLTYVSHTMGEGYEDFDNAHIYNRERVQFSKTAMNNSGYDSIPAGTVITIVFQAKETMTEDFLESSLELKMSVMPVGLDAIKSTDSVSIKICREAVCFEAGQQVTLAVILDQELIQESGIRNFQGELCYDTELLSYVSHVMGDAYEDFDNAHILVHKRVQFSKTAMNSTGYGSIPAGTVITIVLQVKEAMTRSRLMSLLELKVDLMPVGMDLVVITDRFSIQLDLTTRMGDVDGDNDVDVRDAITILQAIASANTGAFTAGQKTAADVNRDGRINTRDVIIILEAVAKKTTDQL